MKRLDTRNDSSPYLSAEELADRLRVNSATVRRHAAELGGFRVGRVWRFHNDEPAPTLTKSRRGPAPADGRLKHV